MEYQADKELKTSPNESVQGNLNNNQVSNDFISTITLNSDIPAGLLIDPGINKRLHTSLGNNGVAELISNANDIITKQDLVSIGSNNNSSSTQVGFLQQHIQLSSEIETFEYEKEIKKTNLEDLLRRSLDQNNHKAIINEILDNDSTADKTVARKEIGQLLENLHNLPALSKLFPKIFGTGKIARGIGKILSILPNISPPIPLLNLPEKLARTAFKEVYGIKISVYFSQSTLFRIWHLFEAIPLNHIKQRSLTGIVYQGPFVGGLYDGFDKIIINSPVLLANHIKVGNMKNLIRHMPNSLQGKNKLNDYEYGQQNYIDQVTLHELGHAVDEEYKIMEQKMSQGGNEAPHEFGGWRKYDSHEAALNAMIEEFKNVYGDKDKALDTIKTNLKGKSHRWLEVVKLLVRGLLALPEAAVDIAMGLINLPINKFLSIYNYFFKSSNDEMKNTSKDLLSKNTHDKRTDKWLRVLKIGIDWLTSLLPSNFLHYLQTRHVFDIYELNTCNFPMKKKLYKAAYVLSSKYIARGLVGGWQLSNAELESIAINDRVFHQANDNEWVSYSLSARKKQSVSNYQWRAPGEWFAEIYATYYLGNLATSHPAYDWFVHNIVHDIKHAKSTGFNIENPNKKNS